MKEQKFIIPWDYILIAIIVIGTITFVGISMEDKSNDKAITSGEIPAICSFKCINMNMTYFAENTQKDFCLCLKDNTTIYHIQRSGELQ